MRGERSSKEVSGSGSARDARSGRVLAEHARCARKVQQGMQGSAGPRLALPYGALVPVKGCKFKLARVWPCFAGFMLIWVHTTAPKHQSTIARLVKAITTHRPRLPVVRLALPQEALARNEWPSMTTSAERIQGTLKCYRTYRAFFNIMHPAKAMPGCTGVQLGQGWPYREGVGVLRGALLPQTASVQQTIRGGGWADLLWKTCVICVSHTHTALTDLRQKSIQAAEPFPPPQKGIYRAGATRTSSTKKEEITEDQAGDRPYGAARTARTQILTAAIKINNKASFQGKKGPWQAATTQPLRSMHTLQAKGVMHKAKDASHPHCVAQSGEESRHVALQLSNVQKQCPNSVLQQVGRSQSSAFESHTVIVAEDMCGCSMSHAVLRCKVMSSQRVERKHTSHNCWI
eukprot:1159028-Pelagomonas_calceolata.AAC.2